MAKLAEKWKNTDKDRVIEFLYLVVLGLYLLKLSFDTTMFYIQWPEDYEVILFIITCGIVMLKIGYSQKCQGLRWLFCVIMGVVFGLAWQHTGYNYLFLLYIPVLIAGAMDVDYRKILRVSFWINFATLALAFIGSCAGVIPDLSYEAEVGYRHSFGIVYTTDFAARVFYLLVIGWVLYDGVHVIVSLLTTAACTWFIWHYCQGKCSIVVLLLFMAAMGYEYLTRSGKLRKKLPIQILDSLIAWLAPVSAGVMLYLSLRYEEDVEWIGSLNRILTSRLMLANKAIYEHRFSLLGTAFEQIGAGGRTAYAFSYNFIDSSYILILLRYGTIVLCILLGLAVYLSRTALQRNQRRLFLAIMVVTVHCIVEHHMPEVNYNIFLILPFAAVKSVTMEERKTVRISTKEEGVIVNRKKRLWRAVVAVAAAAAACGVLLAALPLVMSYVRTLVHLFNYNESENHLYFILWNLAIAAVVLLFVCTGIKIFTCRENRKINIKRGLGLAVPVIVMLFVVINAGGILKKGTDEYAVAIESEQQIIEKITDACGKDNTLYVSDVPVLYRKKGVDVSNKLLPVETCDVAERSIMLITPIDTELSSLLQSGYFFGKLSEAHGIYTNDERAARTLESMGVEMTDYYSVVNRVDMRLMAEANKLHLSEDETLTLSGSGRSIYHGPYISLTSGRYFIEFDLELLNDMEFYQGFARISSDSGATVWAARNITIEDFDENGRGAICLGIDFWCDVENTEFILIAGDGVELKVDSISYCKVGNLTSTRKEE